MLTNSFSQMINVSDRLSLLAGLTARIHQLAEVRCVHVPQPRRQQRTCSCQRWQSDAARVMLHLQALDVLQPAGTAWQHTVAPPKQLLRPPNPGKQCNT
jgi:ABC-type uncharacterized transport system fused permease/ATPase subunit